MKRKILWIEIVSTIFALLILFVVSSIYVNNQNYKTAEDELNSYSNIACEVFDGDNFDELKKLEAARPYDPSWHSNDPLCPNCQTYMIYHFEHCPKCGQKLDWSEK